VFHGEPDEANAKVRDLSFSEGLVMAPFVILIVFMGVFPKPFLDRIEPSVDRLVHHVEEHSDHREPKVAREGQEKLDPAESHDGSGGSEHAEEGGH
jgi:NADH-quinone oxidoreductase subunit M